MKLQERQSKLLLRTRVGRDTLPRYKRTDRPFGETGTVFAFRFKRTPHWVVIGKGWVGNLSEIDFFQRYAPSNAAAREMVEKALARYNAKAAAMQRLQAYPEPLNPHDYTLPA